MPSYGFGKQRINESNPKYIKHPPYTSTFWQDGETLDAGTVMQMVSNQHHLNIESCRQLVCCLSPDINATQDDFRGFEGYDDAAPPSDYNLAPDERQISWAIKTAMKFGPFVTVASDRTITEAFIASRPGIIARPGVRGDIGRIRKVRVILNLYVTSGDCYGYVYLTSNSDTPNAGNIIYKKTFNVSDAGENIADVILGENEVDAAGDNSLLGVGVPGRYLWIGLRWTDPDGFVTSVSAFEIP